MSSLYHSTRSHDVFLGELFIQQPIPYENGGHDGDGCMDSPGKIELPSAFENADIDHLVILIADMLDRLIEHNDKIPLSPCVSFCPLLLVLCAFVTGR